MGYLLGYDIGSSAVKVSLLEIGTGKVIASASSPEKELEISSPRPGWAEQSPELWWEHVKQATAKLKGRYGINLHDVEAIGISYQMHGLVLVDKNLNTLRPSIIWCDSRAVLLGEKAFADIGPELCLQRLLNSPGNFTASKLKWVKDNEPDIYAQIYKVMLPGDYIAMKMSGEIKITPSGLSEGILWDFTDQSLARLVLDYYDISPGLIPDIVPTFSIQGELTRQAASELGLKSGTKISYRAGDQPNNAFSLAVLNPGELATTAGTSGVVYGVGDQPNYDPKSRVNTFVHVNHAPQNPRYGTLLCLNGAGILNRWLKTYLTGLERPVSYEEMNTLAEKAPPGSKGLFMLPYGNGAERTLENHFPGASLHGLNYNNHELPHILRAAQESIVFALNYGLKIMEGIGINIVTVRAGNANMFLSPLFREVFAAVTGATIELYNTDGAQGAARGAGYGAGIYPDFQTAFSGLKTNTIIKPDPILSGIYKDVYEEWLQLLRSQNSI